MSTSVFFNMETDDLSEVLSRKCKCGHKLSEHGFVDNLSSMGYPHAVLWVSECVFCGYDKENQKFNCEGFH